MNKISRLILNTFVLLAIGVSAFAATPLTRVRNFVNDAANNIPITASYMDAELNQILAAANATWVVQSTAPSSPYEGMSWYNTTLHILEEYRNNEWITIGALHVSATEMNNPQQGDLWFNTSTDSLQMYNGSGFVNVTSNNFSSNVGIGTTMPVGGLDVEGTLNPTIFYGFGSGNVGIGTILPGEELDIEKGNVGIGTVTAPNKLSVLGTVEASSYTGQNGTGLLSNQTSGSFNTPVHASTDVSIGAWWQCTGSGNCAIACKTDSNSTPSNVITQDVNGTGNYCHCNMTALKGNYWEVTGSCSGGTTNNNLTVQNIGS